MSTNINVGVLCLPGDPKPEEKEVGRHPKLRPYMAATNRVFSYQCTVCGSVFEPSKSDPESN